MTDWTVYYRRSYHGHKARELSLVSPSRGAALKQAWWIKQQNQGEVVKITCPNEEISSAEVATWCQNNQAKEFLMNGPYRHPAPPRACACQRAPTSLLTMIIYCHYSSRLLSEY